MTRHIRDPVTGKCLVCNQFHGAEGQLKQTDSSDPNAKPTWDDATKKVIYVNAFTRPTKNPSAPPAGAPHPNHRAHSPTVHHYYPNSQPVSPRDVDTDSGITVNSRGSLASTSKVHYLPTSGPSSMVHHHYHGAPGVERGYTPPASPPRKSRWPNTRKVKEYDGKDRYGHHDTRHGDSKRWQHNYKNKHGSAYHTGSTHQGAGWGRRRCCTLVWVLLILLLLAGIAVGLYFLITYLQTQEAANDPQVVNPGGYMQNGVYVLPVTKSPEETFFIIGKGIPCNQFNNGTYPINDTVPNCAETTTRIVPTNYSTTAAPTAPPRIVFVPAHAHRTTSTAISMFSCFILSSFYRYLYN